MTVSHRETRSPLGEGALSTILHLAPIPVTPTKPLTPSHVKGLLWLDVLERATRLVRPVHYQANRTTYDITWQTLEFWDWLDCSFGSASEDVSDLDEISLGHRYVAYHLQRGEHRLRAKYLVGCDGGVSTVRKTLGIPLEGRGRIRKIHQTFFRSERLYRAIPCGRGRHYYFAEGAIVVQDDLRHFMLNFYNWQEGQDAKARLHELFGLDVDIEVLNEADWHHNLLVAERYRDRRVFIAGDAAHLVIPQGALGMNTGAGDATDLAWKLAATLAGWGGPRLLDAYEDERREIGLRNRQASSDAAASVARWRAAITDDFRAPTPAGEAARRAVAELAIVNQPISHELHGIELGYRYTQSPLIALEDSGEDSGVRYYRPTATPGARLPHLWRADGTAVHDALGGGFTLLGVAAAPDAATADAWIAAMRRISAPIEVVRMPEAHLRRHYGANWLLVRPDLHVAWRGDRIPDSVDALVANVTGH